MLNSFSHYFFDGGTNQYVLSTSLSNTACSSQEKRRNSKFTYVSEMVEINTVAPGRG